MKAHSVNLLLLSAILNFATTTYGHLYHVRPPLRGLHLYRNQLLHEPINDKLLDLLKEKQRNQVIIQNINRRSGFDNNQESALRWGQRGQPVGQNYEEKIVNPNSELLERLTEQRPGELAMQNGLDIHNKLQSILGRLKQTQKYHNVVQNVGQNDANPIFDLLHQLGQETRGNFVVQNVNRRLERKFINNNPEARLQPKHLGREQYVVQNIGRNTGHNPSIEGLLGILSQNNRGRLIVQNVNQKPTLDSINNPEDGLEPLAHLQKKSKESVVQNIAKSNDINPILESLPVSLETEMQNVKQNKPNPENDYFHRLIGPLSLQYQEKTMPQNIAQNDGLNFGNYEALRLKQNEQVLIKNGKQHSDLENNYAYSPLEQFKEHGDHVSMHNIHPNKHRYQNNELETITLKDPKYNEHKHGLKEIINDKNYVSLKDTPFDQIDSANRNLLLNIFIEKYIPQNIKRILINARTKEEKEKVPMLLRNYKVISFAFANFLRYSNPLAGYIKSLRIISENMKQSGRNYFVPIQIIQKEIENLSQLKGKESGFKIKSIDSSPGLYVEDLNLRDEDLPENDESLEERPASNHNTETLALPEENAEIETDVNKNVTNQEYTKPNVPDYEMMRELNSVALHQKPMESVPPENVEDSTILHGNEDEPTVIGLDHHPKINDNHNSSDWEDIKHEPSLVVPEDNDFQLAVTETHLPETKTDEPVTEYIGDTDLEESQNEISRPSLRINTQIDEVFCTPLNTAEAIDIMEEVLYNVMGELNNTFGLDSVIYNVTRHAITKTLHDKKLHSTKRCDNGHGVGNKRN